MATKDPRSQWRVLRDSPDYRDFLRNYLELNSLSYAEFARHAGFGRGFPSDVISGRRRLTAKSYVGFLNALKLRSTEKKLFKLLVAKEEIEIFPELRKLNSHLDDWIGELRLKANPAHRRETSENKNAEIERLFASPSTLSIYAAAGEPGKGATFQQIQTRTQLPAPKIDATLTELEKAGLIRNTNGTFEPQDLHLFFQSHDQNAFVFKIFKQACQLAAQRAETQLQSQQEFFFTSSFCVAKQNLPDLKKKLRDLMLSYVDDTLQADGDQVVHLLSSLHL